jgi:hypothetical protein
LDIYICLGLGERLELEIKSMVSQAKWFMLVIPRYLGGRDQEDFSLRPASQDKKFARPHLNQEELGVVVHSCHSSYGGKHKYEDYSSY